MRPAGALEPGTGVVVLLDGVEYTAVVLEPRDENTPTVVQVPPRCCQWHSRRCEAPSELCCGSCSEAAHPHADGSRCDAPDLGRWRGRAE